VYSRRSTRRRIPVVLGGCGSGRTSLLLRLESLIGRERAQYLDMAAAATTPERCLAAIRSATGSAHPAPAGCGGFRAHGG
jgi:Na+/citrate or Na+/malate symporter